MFSHHCYKAGQLSCLLAFMNNEALHKGVLILVEEFAARGANSFL